MNINETNYINILKKRVCDSISNYINVTNIDSIIEKNLIETHLKKKQSEDFQLYYFKTLNDEYHYLNTDDFFKQFKKRYSLQGIDNDFLERLESKKLEILKAIRDDQLTQLYFDYFNKVAIKYGDNYMDKDLGSFFSKLVHTFRPEDYCALDNPIKNYFGLAKESFVVSFFIISAAYKQWAKVNHTLIIDIRERLYLEDQKKIINFHKLTDIKLLDLIFWSKANKNENTR